MRTAGLSTALLLLSACNPPITNRSPVFIAGRPVAAIGDTVFGVAAAGGPVIVLRASGIPDTIGRGALEDPFAIQRSGDAWWVSDVREGLPAVVRLARSAPPITIPLGREAVQPHQFAVLPDGGLVYEVADHRLVVRRGDSVATFAVVERGDRPSLLTAASGGALHAVPGKHITLYNAFGHVRWRITWPWVETAHMAAATVDPRGRIQLLSGVADEGTFIVYTIEPSSGEITRWSVPDSNATFTVDRLGDVSVAGRQYWRLD